MQHGSNKVARFAEVLLVLTRMRLDERQ
jgi:hypothetical protein